MQGGKLNAARAGGFVCMALGMAFLLSIVAALAWGSYLTYYSLVAKGVRNLDEFVATRVIDRLDERRPPGSALEGLLIQASVRECVATSFNSERVHTTLVAIAGWHGWRGYTEEELHLRAETLLTSCLKKLNHSVQAHDTDIASVR